MFLNKDMDLNQLLLLTINANASDLHLIVGIPPTIRVDGELQQLHDYPVLSSEQLQQLIFPILTPEQKEMILSNKELDFSIGFGGGAYGDKGRFRVNLYFQRTYLSADFRLLPPKIRTLEELNIPAICHDFAKPRQGFVLLTGPTGHGKSSTIAAMVNEINLTRGAHILTIEDPIEYMYPKGKSIISQREIGNDTHSWAASLRAALREDPDVVLIGEMRDPETIAAALTIAETGHLVFSTLHTNSAAQSIDRIIDSFPAHQQNQVRMQLSLTLKAVVSQRLLPRQGGGRIPAVEVLIATSAVSSNIRDGRTHLIDSIIQTSSDIGMIPFDKSLAELVNNGDVSLDVAKNYALHEKEFLELLKQ